MLKLHATDYKEFFQSKLKHLGRFHVIISIINVNFRLQMFGSVEAINLISTNSIYML